MSGCLCDANGKRDTSQLCVRHGVAEASTLQGLPLASCAVGPGHSMSPGEPVRGAGQSWEITAGWRGHIKGWLVKPWDAPNDAQGQWAQTVGERRGNEQHPKHSKTSTAFSALTFTHLEPQLFSVALESSAKAFTNYPGAHTLFWHSSHRTNSVP